MYFFLQFSLPQKAVVQPTGCSVSERRAHPSNPAFQNPLIIRCGKGKPEPGSNYRVLVKSQDREGTFQHDQARAAISRTAEPNIAPEIGAENSNW